jgi:hypothetical protein
MWPGGGKQARCCVNIQPRPLAVRDAPPRDNDCRFNRVFAEQ